MKRKTPVLLLSLLSSFLLPSCDQYLEGTIHFDLNGGAFPESFHFASLSGESGARIETEIPNPTREGYYFVGWRLQERDGTYSEINSYLDQQTGESYYRFPYGDVTLVAYFEPLMTLAFDLTEGAERNGTLVAPENASYYDATAGVLDGYTTMSIPSTIYLPTASADHLNFQYWYTRYPLVEVTDELGTTHFVEDTSSPEGVYRFDTGFEGSDGTSQGMSFPESEDGQLTLYASWTEDPSVTIHYNLDGVPDSSFQLAVGEDISQPLVERILQDIGIDLSQDGYKYYQDGAIDLRFAGAFLDAAFAKPFPFPSTDSAEGNREEVPISTENVDIYLDWNRKVDLTLDYGEGTLGGESSFHSEDYYVGDVLGADFAQQHRPTKENADFMGFTFQGTGFNLALDPLPETEDGVVTLLASYDDYPELTIVVDYPDSQLNITQESVAVRSGTDLSATIDETVQGLPTEGRESFSFSGIFYQQLQEDGSYGEKTRFSTPVMPTSDTIVTIEMGYKSVVRIHPMAGAYGETYQEFPLSDFVPGYETTRLFGSAFDPAEGTFVPENYDAAVLSPGVSSLEDVLVSGRTYFYEGVFTGADLSSALLPSGAQVSRDQAEVVDVYLKFTQSIDVTVHWEDGSRPDRTVTVLPGLGRSEFFRLVYGTDFDDSTIDVFYQDPSGELWTIDRTLPTVDCTLTLRPRA